MTGSFSLPFPFGDNSVPVDDTSFGWHEDSLMLNQTPSTTQSGAGHTRKSSLSSVTSTVPGSYVYDCSQYGASYASSPTSGGSKGSSSSCGTILASTHSHGSGGIQILHPSSGAYRSIAGNINFIYTAGPINTTHLQLSSMPAMDPSTLPTSSESMRINAMLEDTPTGRQTPRFGRDDHLNTTRQACAATCGLTPRRSKSSKVSERFWCTHCGRGFVKKFDWKSHLENFRERFDKYPCDSCDMFFYIKDKYKTHHRNEHDCVVCSDEGSDHANLVKTTRDGRIGWGCGFCCYCSMSWRQYCDHLACQHYDPLDPRDRKTVKDWNHSQAIRSLLTLPVFAEAWKDRLNGADGTQLQWDRKKTERAEGYPDSGRDPHLQDLLEWFTDENALPEVLNRALEESNAPRWLTAGTPHTDEIMQVMKHSSIFKSISSTKTSIHDRLHEQDLGEQINDSHPMPTQMSRYDGQNFGMQLDPSSTPWSVCHIQDIEAFQQAHRAPPWSPLENNTIHVPDHLVPTNVAACYEDHPDNGNSQ